MTDDDLLPNRRRFLTAAVVATTGVLAGCSSGSGGTNPNPTTERKPTGDLSCPSVSSEYTGYDAGESPVIADFEYPSMIDNMQISLQQESLILIEGRREFGDGGRIRVSYRQSQVEDTSMQGSESVASVTFGGESRTIYSVTEQPDQTRLVVPLTYGAGGEDRPFQVTIAVDGEAAGGQVPEPCATAINEAAIHAAKSLSPNPDATVGGGN